MTPFSIDFSVYPEAVAEVLFKEMQKHAFELGYKWTETGKTIEKYNNYFPVTIFENNELSNWIGTPSTYKKQISVEEFLEMKKEPEYHVGTPMISNFGNVSIYIGEGENKELFKAIPIKHSREYINYTRHYNHGYDWWKPIDPSRIKVTIN